MIAMIIIVGAVCLAGGFLLGRGVGDLTSTPTPRPGTSIDPERQRRAIRALDPPAGRTEVAP